VTELQVRELELAGGRRARAVVAPRDAAGADLVRALELPPPRATVVLVGTAAPLEPQLEGELERLLRDELAPFVVGEGLTLLTGATDAGVFRLVGRGLEHARAPRIGVAPGQLVTERPDASDRVPLEPHHSHFVLVEGSEWGDEVSAAVALADTLGSTAPAVVVLVGGGDVARGEVAAHLAAGRAVIAVVGSGRLADELVAAGHPAVAARRPGALAAAVAARVLDSR
jgi:SLOG in TRPM, prokaryote